MSRRPIVAPVLFVNDAPTVGTRLPDRSPPKARSRLSAPLPKLYVSPAVFEPVPAA
jgi:hypothetical protein